MYRKNNNKMLRMLVIVFSLIIAVGFQPFGELYSAVYAESTTAETAPEQWEVNKEIIEAYFFETAGVSSELDTWKVEEIPSGALAQNRVRIYGEAGNISKISTVTLSPAVLRFRSPETLFGIQVHEYLHKFSSNESLTEFVTWLVCLELERSYTGVFGNQYPGASYVYDADKYYQPFIDSGLTTQEAIAMFINGTLEPVLNSSNT